MKNFIQKLSLLLLIAILFSCQDGQIKSHVNEFDSSIMRKTQTHN